MIIKIVQKRKDFKDGARDNLLDLQIIRVYSHVTNYNLENGTNRWPDGSIHSTYDMRIWFSDDFNDFLIFDLYECDYIYIMNDEGKTIDKLAM